MPINQAYDRLYSDKVSKFGFLGQFPTLLDPYWQRLLSNHCPQFFMHYFNFNRDISPRKTRSSDKL